jgi:hypothetical protein
VQLLKVFTQISCCVGCFKGGIKSRGSLFIFSTILFVGERIVYRNDRALRLTVVQIFEKDFPFWIFVLNSILITDIRCTFRHNETIIVVSFQDNLENTEPKKNQFL